MGFHLHLVSDSTGETIDGVARACLAQFEGTGVREHFWTLVKTPRRLAGVLEGIEAHRGLVLYTFVDESLQAELEAFCRAREIAHIDALRPVLAGMAAFFGIAPSHMPGRQHVMDADYFARIDAMDFALAQDDGHGGERLEQADVVVIGVSRTSKTPTCIYLAGRGIRAANIPLVPGQEAPQMLFALKKPLVIGLTENEESLIAIRKHRLQFLNGDPNSSYADPEKVREEVRAARRVFARLGCPVIDVSRRSIEETAAEIMNLLDERKAALSPDAP